MEQTDIAHFKALLQKEEARLLAELNESGRINPTNPNDWEGTYSNLKPEVGADEITAEADDIDQGDLLEEYEERNATETVLEGRHNEVNDALRRIEEGTYGICTIDGNHPIERERLEANPAAKTCTAHLK